MPQLTRSFLPPLDLPIQNQARKQQKVFSLLRVSGHRLLRSPQRPVACPFQSVRETPSCLAVFIATVASTFCCQHLAPQVSSSQLAGGLFPATCRM